MSAFLVDDPRRKKTCSKVSRLIPLPLSRNVMRTVGWPDTPLTASMPILIFLAPASSAFWNISRQKASIQSAYNSRLSLTKYSLGMAMLWLIVMEDLWTERLPHKMEFDKIGRAHV